MAISNENNRPQIAHRMPAISATGKYALVFADKDLLIHQAGIVLNVAIAADGSNNVDLQLVDRDEENNETAIGVAVSTSAGASAGARVAINVPEQYRLRVGHTLLLSATVTGTGSIDASLFSLDYEIKGN